VSEAERQILPPDLEALIVDTLEKLDTAAIEARLNEDPIRIHLLALAGFLKAVRRLYVDGAVTLASEIREARQPVQDEELRRAVTRGIVNHAGAIVGTLRWWICVVGAALLFTAFLGGGVTAYVIGRFQVRALNQALTGQEAGNWLPLLRMNDLAAALQNCQPVPQPHGGQACAFTLWTQPPPPAAER